MSTQRKRQLYNKGCRWKHGVNKRDANMSEKNQRLENNVTATVNVCRTLRMTVPVNNLGHTIKNVVCTSETSTHFDRGRQGSQSRVV